VILKTFSANDGDYVRGKRWRGSKVNVEGPHEYDKACGDAVSTARNFTPIRKWITEWDLKYLDQGYRPDIEVIELKQDYSENGDLEVESEDSSEASEN
jgi:hypothetical protein